MEDRALAEVVEFFLHRSGFERHAAETLRRALDEVIDGMRTGRWSIDSLEKTEKTYIGTKVEILFRFEFELDAGLVLDTRIQGHEVDIKCTVQKDWMIPRESLNRLCLLVQVDDARSRFSIGVVRAKQSILRPSINRDLKASLSSEGKKTIRWLVKDSKLPENFLARLDANVRDKIMAHPSGQLRINELLRLVQERIIPRVAIETVARQKDPMKRVRDARTALRSEGILVLGHHAKDTKIARSKGLPTPKKGEVLSVFG
jgi:hypothetical protein